MAGNRAAAVLALSCIAGLAGCGSSSSSASESPGQYMSAVCQAFTPLSAEIRAPTPTQLNTPAARKAALIRLMDSLENGIGQALPRLRAAGAPKIANGSEIASSTVFTLNKLYTSLTLGARQARRLPTTSLSAFESASQLLTLRTFGSVEASGASLSAFKDPELVKAAAGQPACHGVSLSG